MKKLPCWGVLALSCAANAAPCPPQGAPAPTMPPFHMPAPPAWKPEVRMPMTIKEGEAPKVEVVPPTLEHLQAIVPPRDPDGRIPVREDGHVVEVLHMRGFFRPGPPEPTPPWMLPVAGTPLAGFKLVGFGRVQSPNRVSRYFERGDGTAVILKEWDFAADGGSIWGAPSPFDVDLGKVKARFTGMRGPSGCVSTELSWQDERRHRELELVGPQDGAGQRALAIEIARALEALAR